MSSAKWCPEIGLCNSSNEKDRDGRIKTWEGKNSEGEGGRKPQPQMHKVCTIQIRQISEEAGCQVLSAPLVDVLHFWIQGLDFLVFVFLPLVAARLIKVHKQWEMCSLMSKCFCKRDLSLGSWPCHLTLYPNPVSCISGQTTRPFSLGLIVSSISFSLSPGFFVVYFTWKLSAAMPPDMEGSVAKSGKVTHNEELRLLCSLP